MVKIRLTRLGKHKSPFYRIVAVDSRNKRDGGYLALVGTYEPFEGKVNFKSEVISDLLSKGAVPSETVLNLLKEKGIWKQFQQTKSPKATKPEKKTNSKKATSLTKKLKK